MGNQTIINKTDRNILLTVAESDQSHAVVEINKFTGEIKYTNAHCKSHFPWMCPGKNIDSWTSFLNNRDDFKLREVIASINYEIPFIFSYSEGDKSVWLAAYLIGDYGDGAFLKIDEWASTSINSPEFKLALLTAINSSAVSKLFAKVEMLNLKQEASVRDLLNTDQIFVSDINLIKDNLKTIEKDLNQLNQNVDYTNKTSAISIETIKKISEDINSKLDLHRDSIIQLMGSDELLKFQINHIQKSIRETTEGSISDIRGAVKSASSDITRLVTIPASVALAIISFMQWLISHYIGK